MSSRNSWRRYAREYARSRSGVIGAVMLVALLSIAAYVVLSVPGDEARVWNNPQAWTSNPSAVPPTWVGYLGEDAPPTIDLALGDWSVSGQPGAYTYTASSSFAWNSQRTPSNVALSFATSGSALEASLTWQKPDGGMPQVVFSSPAPQSSYDLSSTASRQYLTQYLQSQGGSAIIASVSQPQELSALFARDGPGILSNPVVQGEYRVTLQIVSGSQLPSVPTAAVSLLGDSFGGMGTDLYGRPIQLGILAGVPSALELGVITSVLSVFGGVLFGGVAGFLGGRRDGVMQWCALVVLALPALPFLVALSYSYTLGLITEAVLIAALSWPFYAIIARSVSLSIKSQTYVEADRAMGVSSARSFLSHFLPRLVPVSIAYTALGVPAGIILAQTLAFLGIQPENIITWGGMLDDAFASQAALYGWWWWILIPGLMIIVISVPFVLIGFALDRIVAPRASAR